MTTAANLSQSSFRGRSDTGAVDTAPTWIAAQNTGWLQATNAAFRVRFLIQNTTSGTPTASMTVKLQANKNGGLYQDVTTTSTVVKAVDAGTSADETTIATARLAGSGTYVAGRYDETGGVSTGVTIAGSGNTEYEFGIRINASDVAVGDTVGLKVVTVSGSTITASLSPTLTAGATYTVAAVQGAYSWSIADLVTFDTGLLAASGSYTRTGNAAGLAKGRFLAAVSGVYSLTGIAAKLPRRLTAASGSYSDTGNLAFLNPPGRTSYSLPAVQGAYSWQIADLVTFDTGLLAAAGSYAQTGNAAVVGPSRQFPAESGSYTMSGAPGIYDQSLFVNFFGSYSLTGNTANLVRSVRPPGVLPAVSGSYAATGSNANLKGLLRAITASYGLTGSAALYKRTMVSPTGLYSRTGTPATMTIQHPPAVTVFGAVGGVYGLTSNIAAFRRTFLAASGSYTQTGNVASLQPPGRLNALAGSYTLSGKANALSRLLSAAGGIYVQNSFPAVPRTSSSALACDAGNYAMFGNLASFSPGSGLWIEAIKQVETWTTL